MTKPGSDAASAKIIQFPLRRDPRNEGQERLRRALEDLEAALAGQLAAVAAWRGALGELSRVVGGVGDSLRRYRGNLDTLAARVGSLNAQAVQLERTADAVLALSQDPAR